LKTIGIHFTKIPRFHKAFHELTFYRLHITHFKNIYLVFEEKADSNQKKEFMKEIQLMKEEIQGTTDCKKKTTCLFVKISLII